MFIYKYKCFFMMITSLYLKVHSCERAILLSHSCLLALVIIHYQSNFVDHDILTVLKTSKNV